MLVDRSIAPNIYKKAPDVITPKIHSDKRMENTHTNRHTHTSRELS